MNWTTEATSARFPNNGGPPTGKDSLLGHISMARMPWNRVQHAWRVLPSRAALLQKGVAALVLASDPFFDSHNAPAHGDMSWRCAALVGCASRRSAPSLIAGGRVYFCAWSWVELGHDVSRERCRTSAPAKRGRGTTRRVVEGAAEQTIMRAFRKDDSPQLDLRERSGGGWRSIDPRPGILPADKGASLNSSGPKFAVDCNWRALRPQGKKNNDAADAKRHAGRP
jgi:hypothetical protein